MFKLRNTIFTIISAAFILLTVVQTVSAASLNNRLYGIDRYETAVAISKNGWEKTNYAVLATGGDFPDALCAAPLAKKFNAPILLVESNNIGSSVEAELIRLGVKKVFLIGGQGVISVNVENKLKSKGIETVRFGGKDRYETSLIIARNLDPSDKVVIATGNDFADALSISPIAASQNMPILLADKNYLPDSLKQYIDKSRINKTYLIGGTGVVGVNVERSVPNPERLSGTDRYETNYAVVNKFSVNLNFTNTFISTGKNFPDALSGSALAGKLTAPLILIDGNILSSSADLINSKLPQNNKIVILGGESVVSNSAYTSIQRKITKIMIDPGHGGIIANGGDPGAVSEINNVVYEEARLNLQVALKLQSELKNIGYDVVMTRTTDAEKLSLDERVVMANTSNADLFISLHHDISDNQSVSGISTHYSSYRPNIESDGVITGNDPYGWYSGVYIDQTPSAQAVASKELAEKLVSELSKSLNYNNRYAHDHNLAVTKGTNMVSTLVELGFISNSDEAKRCADPNDQLKKAQVIARVINEYMNSK